MNKNPNTIIEKRLRNIENRIARIAFLHAHLKKFKKDRQKIEDPSRAIEGISLFYFYSFSQFILEINKLFNSDPKEYYTIPKLLNHIETNLKHVGWYKCSISYPDLTKEQIAAGKPVWSSGDKKEWLEKANGQELIEKQKMVFDLKQKIQSNNGSLEEIKLARDKVIAHLDKNFMQHNFSIKLETVERMLYLAHEIYNTLNLSLCGGTLGIQHIDSNILSTLLPITKYYELQKCILSTRSKHQQAIEVETLMKIIQ